MIGTTADGKPFFIKASFFQHLIAFASEGRDEARFYGTNSADTFLGTTVYGKLSSPDENRSLRAYGFDEVRVWGGGGYDVAHLHDSHLGDELINDKTWAQLSNDELDFLLWVTDFEEVHAYSTSSGDKIHMVPADFLLLTEGTWKDF